MIDAGLRFRFIGEVVHRGVPPKNCAMGCPEHLSEICATCYRRPIKEIEKIGG